jgi:hypothetical protein
MVKLGDRLYVAEDKILLLQTWKRSMCKSEAEQILHCTAHWQKLEFRRGDVIQLLTAFSRAFTDLS